MMNLKERRNQFRVVAITVMSMIAMLFFQNCGNGISNSQSIQSSSTAPGNNTSSGTGNGGAQTPGAAPAPSPNQPPVTTPSTMPAPAPAPPPAPGSLPVTQSLRQQLCNPFIDTSKKISYLASPAILTDVTITSASGNGGTAVGNGDTADNTVMIPYKFDTTVLNIANSQAITPPSQFVQTQKIACAFDFKTTIEVVKGNINGTNYDPSFTKAIDVKTGSATFGKNIASKDPATAQGLVARVVKFATAAITVASNNASITVNLQRDDSGLRCVEGYFYFRFAMTAQVEGSNITQSFTATDPNYRYVKVNVKDGCWAESHLTPATAPVRIAGFGSAVASSPNWMAVLATKDDGISNGNTVASAGSVTMFKKNGANWDFCQKITVPNAVALEGLTSIALSPSGNLLAIGNAVAKDANGLKAGAVHIYNNSGNACSTGNAWTWRQKLASDTEPRIGQGTSNKNQLFGTSVAVTDSRLVVGAPLANGNNGAVYVFSCSGGACSYSDLITNADGINAGFGTSLSLSNSTLAIGAPQAVGYEGDGDGFVSLYDIGGAVSAITKIRPTDIPNEKSTNMRFGDSLSVLGGRLLVGAPYHTSYDGNNTAFGGAGAAYYFNWNGQSAPSASAPSIKKRIIGANTANLFVGRGVALHTDGILVGQDGTNAREGLVGYYSNAKAAALAETSNFGGVDYTIFALDKGAGDDFGYSISVSGNNIAIGARVKDSPNRDGGVAYVYAKP